MANHNNKKLLNFYDLFFIKIENSGLIEHEV